MLRRLAAVLAFLSLLSQVQAEPADFIATEIAGQATAPKTPLEFITLLRDRGYQLDFHIVANRGWHNSSAGSFSSFVTVTGNGLALGDMTFGVFIEPNPQGILRLQNSWETSLLVEVIVKDQKHGLKNFWELIGEKSGARWYYRGNSFDIVADSAKIHLGEGAYFGDRLRCSGCHINGDLVMKERFPYNDWKPAGKALETGQHKLSATLSTENPESAAAFMISKASPPAHLDKAVRQSLTAYVKRLAEVSAQSDRQWLRSLLAPLEINLVCDSKPLGHRNFVEIPASFFLDPLLSGPQPPIRVPLKVYQQALARGGSSFAADETKGLVETQHPFLIPVRSLADELKIAHLVDSDKLDPALIKRFLSLDFTTPIFSPERLELMECVPLLWESSADLEAKVILPRAVSQQRLVDYLAKLRGRANRVDTVVNWLKLAHQRRLEIQAAQISSNKRGSILEGGLGPGGFRRIFPSYSGFKVEPGQWMLDPVSAKLVERPAKVFKKRLKFEAQALHQLR